MKIAIYVRISKSDGTQNTERQLSQLLDFCREQKWVVVNKIEEHVSGRKKKREGTEKLIRLAKSNQIQKVVIHEISRLGRNLADVVQTVEQLTENKVSVFDYRQRLETLDINHRKTPFATMVLPVLAGIAEEYAEQQSYRIKSGLQRAKEKGKSLGRPKDRPIKKEGEILKLLKDGISIRKTATKVGVANSTVQQVSKKYSTTLG
jgi:DNA invertase Pin-like site-specific DNA recombinase